MRICTVLLTGISTYSQSRQFDTDSVPKLEKETADEYDKRNWREKMTTNADGEVCIPAMALKMGVDEAIKRLRIKIPGKGTSTYSKLFVSGQLCERDIPIGVMKEEAHFIDLWSNADGIRGSGKRVKRRFPVFHKWGGEARFLLLDDEIPNAIFERGIIEAGRLIGVGRFRPEKGGLNGRFDCSDFRWSDV